LLCFEILLEFCFIILALNVYQSAQAAYKAKLFLSEITNFLLFPTWWYVKTTYIRGTKKKGSSYRKSVALSKSTTYLGSHLSRLNIFFIQFSEVKLAYDSWSYLLFVFHTSDDDKQTKQQKGNRLGEE